MSDTKILQAILDNQVSVKKNIKDLDKKVEEGFRAVNGRIDKLGKSLAYLEEDAPTREEYGVLEKRVGKLEKKVTLT